MDDPLAQLEEELCPPLDPTLVRVVLSDFTDLESDQQVSSAREILEPIKQAALEEEANAVFDPSGSGGANVRGVFLDGERHGEGEIDDASDRDGSKASSRISPSEHTDGTDLTSVSNGISSLGINGTAGASVASSDSGVPIEGKDGALEVLESHQKEALLCEIFPCLSPVLVGYILKKSDGEFGRATEELLNHAFFAESEEISSGSGDKREGGWPKGVDAFAEENMIPRARKGKNRRKKAREISAATDAIGSSQERPPGLTAYSGNAKDSVWKRFSGDIDFVSSRLGITKEAVSSVYHQSGTSLPATVAKLLDTDSAASYTALSIDEEVLATEVSILQQDFPTISRHHATALLRLTYPSTASAHELAKVLTAAPLRSPGHLEIIRRYTPIDLHPSSSSPPASTPSLLDPHISYNPHSTPDHLTAARARALEQATAAHRKGRSDPGMRAAASYYADLARDLGAAQTAAAASAADALVAARSTATVLDLHGVGVRDGARIAQTRVRAWWDGLGEERVGPAWKRRGGAQMFTIVTGKGTHSEGGVGRMGPAVLGVLLREGWKVRAGNGVVVVEGVKGR